MTKPTLEPLQRQKSCLGEATGDVLLAKSNRSGKPTPFRDVFFQSFPFSLILDTCGHVLEMNDAISQLNSGFAANLVGRPIWEAPCWQNLAAMKQQTQRIIERVLHGETVTGRASLPQAPHHDRYLDLTYSPVRDSSGHIYLIAVIGLDVTDKLQIEQALKASEWRYRQLTTLSPAGICQMDTHHRCVYANEAWLKMAGMSLTEALGNGWTKNIHPQDRNGFKQAWKKMVASAGRWGHEYRFRTPAQKTTWVYGLATPIANGAGIVCGYLGVNFDISDQKRMQDQLAQSEEMFRALFHQAGGHCMILDPSKNPSRLTIMDVNEAACSAHGYARKEMIGRSISDFLSEKDHRLMRDRQKLILSGKSLVFNADHKREDGSTFPVMVYANLLQLKDKPPLVLTTGHDISDIRQIESEKRSLEEKLRQSQKMESIGNLAGGIAHDFNNILTSIIGFTELTLDDAEKGTSLESHLNEVYRASIRAKDLVKQILTFARQSDEEQAPIQASAIVKETLQLMRSTIPTTIEIRHSIESDALIKGNPTQLRQVLMNLFTNAAQAMENEGGVLTVKVQKIDVEPGSGLMRIHLKPCSYLQITIVDTGCGISPAIIGSIFDPYFTTKKVGEGTGLGLAMVHGIVETHGGKITVDSMVNEGSEFNIYLPVTQSGDLDEPIQGMQLPGGSEHILFVDDEMQIVRMSSNILKRLGYKVTARTSSIEALERFRANPDDIDLVIADMTMPNMTGDRLATELMKIRPDIAVIICTGYSKKLTDDMARKIGIKTLIYKPVVRADLAQKVRKVLDGNSRSPSE